MLLPGEAVLLLSESSPASSQLTALRLMTMRAFQCFNVTVKVPRGCRAGCTCGVRQGGQVGALDPCAPRCEAQLLLVPVTEGLLICTEGVLHGCRSYCPDTCGCWTP